MVDYDSMAPRLELAGAQFFNFFLSKLSCDFKLRGMSILQDSAYYLRLESHGRVRW